MPLKLQNKVMVITGGGSGIGRSICYRFAEEGAKLVIADINPSSLNKTINEIKSKTSQCIGKVIDVRNETQVQELIDAAINAYGRIDILVNAAGILGPMSTTIENLSSQEWTDTLGINLISSANTMKYALPALKNAGGGSIINISSTAGLNPIDGAAPYCVSKAGVIMLTRVAALEYGKFGIRVNTICPDMIDTPMMDAVVSHLKEIGVSNVRENISSGSVLNRFGKPEEVASLALFLACDEDSSFITGGYYLIDGGSMCK